MDSVATEPITAPDLPLSGSPAGPDAPPSDSAKRRERIGRATFAITLLHLAGRLFGLVEAKLVSLYAGTAIGGVYYAASALPWSVFNFGEQLLTHGFLPPFVQARERRGEESAWKLASLVATVLTLLLVAVVGGGMLFAPQILHLYTRHFDESSLALAASLVRIMLPAVLIMSVSSLTYVLLNAYKQFALPALGDAALKLGVVISGLLLWRALGIRAFAVGLLLGACFKLAVHLWGLRGPVRLFRWTLDTSDGSWKPLVALMIPLVAGNMLSVIRPLLDVYFSGAREEVAALNFAVKLSNLPFMLIPYAMSIALFPFLAEMATRGDRRSIARALVSALRMVFFLMLPIAAAYLILARPLIETVYLGGKFTTADTGRVMGPLVWYAIGILPLAVETVVLQIFFALSDTKTPTQVAYSTFALYIVVAYSSTHWLGWGAAGVALAFTISKLVKDIILLAILRPRVHGLDLGGCGSFSLKLFAATAIMSAVLWGTLRFGYGGSTGLAAAVTGHGSRASGPAVAATLANTPAATTSPTHAGTVKGHHPPKKPSKTRAIEIFGVCALPGVAAFLLVARWLAIPELALAWGILDRKLRPTARKALAFAMAPW